jgi:putative membrane protein
MFVEYRGSLLGIVGWQWRYIALFTAAALAITAAHTWIAPVRPYLSLPSLPLAVVGGAIGIFTSFRTNSAYDRWWEGRRLWGQLVNTSRLWASQVLCYLEPGEGGPSPLQRRLIERQIAYVHVLRCLLRSQDLVRDEPAARYLKDEAEALALSSNATHALLHEQLADVTAELKAGRLDMFQHSMLEQSIRTLLDVQGGCERIKKTPFPRGYGFIAERLIAAFSLLFPLGVVDDMGWLTIPMSVLVCTSFILISEVGRVLEDPFTMFWPALPLSAISTTIEINLRERLGERNLPPMPKPNARGILM